jgi:hypothetical protein
MFEHMDKDRTGLMVAEGVVDILAETVNLKGRILKMNDENFLYQRIL